MARSQSGNIGRVVQPFIGTRISVGAGSVPRTTLKKLARQQASADTGVAPDRMKRGLKPQVGSPANKNKRKGK